MFAVYVTCYRGNLLPPFYIGVSTTLKIANGYRGSVSSKKYKGVWLSELRTNPQLFVTKVLRTYDTRIAAFQTEQKLLAAVQAHLNPLYTNMALYGDRGIQFAESGGRKGRSNSIEHNEAIRSANKGRVQSFEHLEKRITSLRGRAPWNKGKPRLKPPWNKGLTKETDSRIGSEIGANPNRGKALRNRKYEDIHGPEKAAELKAKRSEKMIETRARMKESKIGS